MDYGILTTRFTNETFYENKRWKENHDYKGCIYTLKTKICEKLNYNKPYYVLEMNNSINKVMGIGIIYIIQHPKREKMYNDIYYNRYTYKGSKYIRIYEDDYIIKEKEKFIELFEKPLFYGKGHMKRGQSMTHFPYKKLTKEHLDYLKTIIVFE
jgi:hypothetical protein|tara:strand:+ start:337 stop:798 length:462 start_codon:yes stop_codon:yes gene_type:complete